MINNKGASLILTIVIMSVLVAVAVGIASIFIREIRLSVFVDDSVIAIMAADAGIEKKLYDTRKLGGNDSTRYTKTLSNGASYTTCPTGSSCSGGGSPFVRVEGQVGNVTRALEITNYR